MREFLGYTKYYAQVRAVVRGECGEAVRLTREDVEGSPHPGAAEVLRNWPDRCTDIAAD
jgi:hypothetical protein